MDSDDCVLVPCPMRGKQIGERRDVSAADLELVKDPSLHSLLREWAQQYRVCPVCGVGMERIRTNQEESFSTGGIAFSLIALHPERGVTQDYRATLVMLSGLSAVGPYVGR